MICTSNTSSAIESFHTAQEGSIEAAHYERGAARGSECRTEEVSSRASSQQLSSWHPQMRESVPQSRLTRSRTAAERSSVGTAIPHRPSRAPICILGRRPSALLSALSGAQSASKWLCRLPQPTPAANHPPVTGILQPAEQPPICLAAQTPQKVLLSEAQPARKRLCREGAELSPATPSSPIENTASLDITEQPPGVNINAQAQTAQEGLGSPQAALQGPTASQKECSRAQSACSPAAESHLQPGWGMPASSSPKKHQMLEGVHGELDTAAGSPTQRSEVRRLLQTCTIAPRQRLAAKHACQMGSSRSCHAIISDDHALESSALPITTEPEFLHGACTRKIMCRQANPICMLHAVGLCTGAWCDLCGDRGAVAGADCGQPQASELLCAASKTHPGAWHY